jgi:hypothetical protein
MFHVITLSSSPLFSINSSCFLNEKCTEKGNTPINSTTNEINAHLGLTNNHPIKKRISKKTKYGKNKPRKPVNHQFCGFR